MEEPARRRPRRVPASGILVSLESSVAVLNRILTAAAVGVDGGGGVWRSRIVEK